MQRLDVRARLHQRVRPQARYPRSLETLRLAKELRPDLKTKSGVMVGLGETPDEVKALMRDLFSAGCRLLTIGQYLAPTQRKRHLPVERFLRPEEFERYRQKGLEMGFVYVESGPLVRSSYLAQRGYLAAMNMAYEATESEVR